MLKRNITTKTFNIGWCRMVCLRGPVFILMWYLFYQNGIKQWDHLLQISDRDKDHHASHWPRDHLDRGVHHLCKGCHNSPVMDKLVALGRVSKKTRLVKMFLCFETFFFTTVCRILKIAKRIFCFLFLISWNIYLLINKVMRILNTIKWKLQQTNLVRSFKGPCDRIWYSVVCKSRTILSLMRYWFVSSSKHH